MPPVSAIWPAYCHFITDTYYTILYSAHFPKKHSSLEKTLVWSHFKTYLAINETYLVDSILKENVISQSFAHDIKLNKSPYKQEACCEDQKEWQQDSPLCKSASNINI